MGSGDRSLPSGQVLTQRDARLPRALRVVFRVCLAWSAMVVLQWLIIVRSGLDRPERYVDMYYYLFAHYEVIGWLVLVIGLVLCLGWALGERPWLAAVSGISLGLLQLRFGLVALLGLLWCGTLFIQHCYPFSMDEFSALFQAEIFSSGRLSALIPEHWRPFAFAVTPISVIHNPADSTWISGYLPVYAALRALCLEVGLSDLLNPILAVVSLPLIADCARRLWPDQPALPLVAATLLLTSSQFWAMSISYYSMPAHLCANLLWLALYLRDTRWSVAALPWLGGLALGLHQPTVHALFVLPYCADIVHRRRFGLALYCLVVYSGFLALWYYWHQLTALETDLMARDLTWFRLLDLEGLFVQTVNLTLLGSWQSVALVLCSMCALFAVRRFSVPEWCLLIGVLLTLALYCLVHRNQGHGWGYRYIYGAFGNIVLLATYGWSQLSQQLGRARAWRLLVVSTCFAVLVQIPLRMYEIEREIRPYAHARDFFRGVSEKIAVVDYSFIWYGQDLIRNDPRLAKSPIMIDASRISPEGLLALRRMGSVRIVRPQELAALKLPVSAGLEKRERAQAAAPAPQ